MIQEKILELTEYGLVTGLAAPEDKRFTINRLLELFQLDELKDEVAAAYEKREPMTQETAEDAFRQGIHQGVFPFGTCVVDTGGRVRSCMIYAVQLDRWITDRSAS